MNTYVYRPEISSYQGEDFQIIEKSSLEACGTTYCTCPNEIPSKADVIVISTSYTNNEEICKDLEHANIVLWIHPNSGYDNFSVDFVTEAKFPIILGNEIRANAVAQYTLQSLFELQTKIPFKKSWDSSRKFNRSLLSQQKILIIGRGIIGNLIGKSLEVLSADINYYDPFVRQESIELSSLVKEADTIILTASLNRTSKHILNKEIFDQLKSDVSIINPSRGKLINQADLIEFLGTNPNARCILDVYEKEPNDLSQFSLLSNIKLTCHIAGVYKNINESIIKFEERIINNYTTGNISQFENEYNMKSKLHGDILI